MSHKRQQEQPHHEDDLTPFIHAKQSPIIHLPFNAVTILSSAVRSRVNILTLFCRRLPTPHYSIPAEKKKTSKKKHHFNERANLVRYPNTKEEGKKAHNLFYHRTKMFRLSTDLTILGHSMRTKEKKPSE